jgi:cell division protein ZapA
VDAPVELRIAGQSYRVVASAEPAQLHRLARLVDEKLEQVAPVTPGAPQALVLAAIALAHDLEQERRRRQEVEARAREMLETLLHRVDAALESVDEEGNSLPRPASTSPDA